MRTNPQVRVLGLLTRFSDGKKVCIDVVQYDTIYSAKIDRRIRRDLNTIKENFSESFEIITKDVFNNFMEKDIIALMVQGFLQVLHLKKGDLMDPDLFE